MGEVESEQVAAAVIKKVAKNKKRKLNEDIELKQLNGGQNLKIMIESHATSSFQKKEVQVKATTVGKIKKKLNLSNRQTETVSRILRSDKVKVEPNTRTFLAAVDNYLASEYINIQIEMEVLKEKDKAKKKKSGIAA